MTNVFDPGSSSTPVSSDRTEDLTFSPTSPYRLRGNFSSGTVLNRLLFVDNAGGGKTEVGALAPTAANLAAIGAFSQSGTGYVLLTYGPGANDVGISTSSPRINFKLGGTIYAYLTSAGLSLTGGIGSTDDIVITKSGNSIYLTTGVSDAIDGIYKSAGVINFRVGAANLFSVSETAVSAKGIFKLKNNAGVDQWVFDGNRFTSPTFANDGCSVYRNANQTSGSVILFDIVTYDSPGNYNPAAGVYTVAKAGTYLVTASVYIYNSTTVSSNGISIKHNAIDVASNSINTPSSSPGVRAACSVLLRAAVGDTIYIESRAALSATNYVVGGTNNRFCVQLVS